MSRPVQRRTAAGPDHVAGFAVAAERFADALAVADPHAEVATCPGWTVYDLACHLGNVHAWAATIVETGRRAPEQNDTPRHRRARVLSAWYAGKAEDLYRVLRAADPDRPCWNFAFGEGPAAFWARRQLHETTMHLIDLQTAVGAAPLPAVDVEVAADGVDEVLTVFLHRMHQRGYPATLTAPLSLLATDAGRAWTVSPRPVQPDPAAGVPVQPRGSAAEVAPPLVAGPPIVVDRRHPQADQVAGPAELLYRVLWKRASYRALTVTGDEVRVRAFLDSRLTP